MLLRPSALASPPIPARTAIRFTPMLRVLTAPGRFRASSPCTICPAGTSSTRRLARRLATHGYTVIAPDLYCREGHGTPDDMAAKVRAAGGVAGRSGRRRPVGRVSLAQGRSRPATARSASSAPARAGARPSWPPRERRPTSTRSSICGAAASSRPAESLTRQAAGRAGRLHQGPQGAAARPVRQRGSVARRRPTSTCTRPSSRNTARTTSSTATTAPATAFSITTARCIDSSRRWTAGTRSSRFFDTNLKG